MAADLVLIGADPVASVENLPRITRAASERSAN
jgi:hypothetical protein